MIRGRFADDGARASRFRGLQVSSVTVLGTVTSIMPHCPSHNDGPLPRISTSLAAPGSLAARAAF